MKTFVAIVVGQGKGGLVQSIHVSAQSYRKAAAVVLRRIRNTWRGRDFQIALRPLGEDSLTKKSRVLAASIPLQL